MAVQHRGHGGALALQLGRARDHDAAQVGAQLAHGGDLRGGPGLGAALHGFAPQLERAGRRQPGPQRADHRGLGRVVAPVDGFGLFAAQQHQCRLRARLVADGQQAGPAVQVFAQFRRQLGQRGGHQHGLAGQLLRHQPAQQLRAQRHRHIAVAVQAGVVGGQHCVGVEHAGDLGRFGHQHLSGLHGVLHLVEQARAQPLVHALFGRLLGRQLGLHMRGQQVGQHVARGPRDVRHLARRAVVAGQHAPQAPFQHDGQAHRRTDADVLQIFDVDRRHAAQHAVAHVQRLIDARRGAHRHRRAAHVGDQAHRVFDVQAARLRRNVAGRKAPAQVGVERRIALLGHDVAAVVGAKAVGHDAVEAGQLAHHVHGVLQQAQNMRLLPKALDRGVQARPVVVRAMRRWAAFELGHQPALHGVHQQIEPAPANLDGGMARLRRVGGRGRPGRLREQRVHGRVFKVRRRGDFAQAGRTGQQGGQVVAGVGHAQIGIQRHQGAVRLDETGNVDRLAVAIAQIHRRRRSGGGRAQRRGHARLSWAAGAAASARRCNS